MSFSGDRILSSEQDITQKNQHHELSATLINQFNFRFLYKVSKIAEITLEMFGIEANEDNLDIDNIVPESQTINIRTTKFLNPMKLPKIF